MEVGSALRELNSTLLLDVFHGCDLLSLRLNDLHVLHLLRASRGWLGLLLLLLLEFLLVLPLLLGRSHLVRLHVDILRLRADESLLGSEADRSALRLRFEVLLLLGIRLEGVSRGSGISASFLVHLRNWGRN